MTALAFRHSSNIRKLNALGTSQEVAKPHTRHAGASCGSPESATSGESPHRLTPPAVLMSPRCFYKSSVLISALCRQAGIRAALSARVPAIYRRSVCSERARPVLPFSRHALKASQPLSRACVGTATIITSSREADR